MSRALVWESVSWRRGEDQFRLEIERGGLFATLSAPGGRSLTLPMVVWEGLLDALKAGRNTKARVEQQQQYLARSRSRWYDGEVSEVADAYKSGRSIGEIAHSHNRSTYAIEHQLDKLGLISKAGIYGPGTDREGDRAPDPSRSTASADASDEWPDDRPTWDPQTSDDDAMIGS